MNTAEKIDRKKSAFRRQGDRVKLIQHAMQRVEREHATRMRRMSLVLVSAAALLLVNGLLITQLG